MSGQQRRDLVISGLRGRDGSTPAEIAIPDHKAKEMENVDLYRTPFARKRNGSKQVFAETTGEAFTGVISALGRHVPGADETAAMLWGVDSAATPVVQYLSGGTAWASPTLKDNIATRPQDVVFVSFNGKLWMFYDSTQDRSHLWDGSTVRREGMATPGAAPTVADTGAGTYAARLRYYRVRYAELSGSTIIRKGEASASVSFTPSGTGTAARVTKPATVSEGETHWELEISTDNSVWFFVARTAVGTTTYDDSADPFSYTTLAPIAGEYTTAVSAKYGVVDGNRMLIAGAWETSTTYSSRVWFTARIGTLNGDDERFPNSADNQFYVDLDEKDGDFITGLGGPFEGMPIVFKYRHIWALRPTGSVAKPYEPLIISKVVGCIRQQLVVMAEDENNQPAIYFWSHRGPYRYGIRGLQFLGDDLYDYLDPDGSYGGVNLDASTVTGFAVHHPDKHQIWFWVSVGSNNTPERAFIFDTRLGEPDEDNHVRDGWTIFTGIPFEARCATMFSTTLGSSMSRDLKPYIGQSGSNGLLLRGDVLKLDSVSSGTGTPYMGYVTLPEKHPWGLTNQGTLANVVVLGSAGPHIIHLRVHRNYGCEPREAAINMAKETNNQTRTQHTVGELKQADAKSVGARIGDICPIGHPWNLDALVYQWEPHQEMREG